jgi:hypothetical protein
MPVITIPQAPEEPIWRQISTLAPSSPRGEKTVTMPAEALLQSPAVREGLEILFRDTN